MIRFLEAIDKVECFKMMEEFYRTDAVEQDIPKEFIEGTIELALTDSPYNKIIICLDGDNYAGFCHISFTYSCEAGGLVVMIEEIYIRDSFKGNGLGTAIFGFLRDSYDNKIKRYRLEVVHDNVSAIKLYERLGFKELTYNQMVLDI